jgi:hypothetical protein
LLGARSSVGLSLHPFAVARGAEPAAEAAELLICLSFRAGGAGREELLGCRGGAAAGGWSSGAVRPRPAGPVAAGAGEAPKPAAEEIPPLCRVLRRLVLPAGGRQATSRRGRRRGRLRPCLPTATADTFSRPCSLCPLLHHASNNDASEHEREAEACKRGTMKELLYSSRSRVIGGGRDFPIAFTVTRCSHLSGKKLRQKDGAGDGVPQCG